MRLLEVKQPNIIVVYGGGFQPFHEGHASSYREAKAAFPGAYFFVAASNVTTERPFEFKEKQFLAQQAGVVDPFIQVGTMSYVNDNGRKVTSTPLNPLEVLQKFNPEKDILVIVRSERDPMKTTDVSYYQPWQGIQGAEPFSKHAYVFVTKKHDFSIAGNPVYSGSQVRELYSGADDKTKLSILQDLYPQSRQLDKIKQIFDKRLAVAENVTELFQPGKQWQWSFTGSQEAVAVFHVGGIPYQFYAYRPDENFPGWDVEFKNADRGKDRTAKFGLTGTGNSAEVMSTIADIMREFLTKYQGKITELTFTADEPSRRALYTKMIKRLLPTWNLSQDGKEFKLSAPTEQGVAEGLNEFAVDGFGDSGDKRSKLLASVGRLLDDGNKVDWQVPGQMGHVTRVQDDGITMKKWKTPHSRMSFFLPMRDDSRDSKYTIKMVAPKHYAVVSAEQGVDEASLATMRDYFAGDKNAHDPLEITKQRLHFAKDKNVVANKRKEFRSQWEYEQWLKKHNLKQISDSEEYDEEEQAANLLEYLRKIHKRWAIVSKKGGRPLVYFKGDGKPSKDWVEKQERRINYFKHKK